MNDIVRFRRLLFLVALLSCAIPGMAAADAVSDFYKGKTVRIIVGYPPGGGYDVYARVLAQFLPRHIPGNPNVIVQNMPGASSLTASNHLYATADKDGTVMAAPSNSLAFAPLQGIDGARFDPTKFNWIGSPNKEVGMLITWNTAPAKTVQDAMKTELTVGSSSANASSSFFARVLNATLGLKLKLILGYPGTIDSYLAMERGETDGYASAFWTSLKATKPQWLSEKKINILVQYGAEPHPDIPDVPFARDVAKAEDDKLLLDVSMAPLAFGRPFMLPPDVPAERVAAIRKAFLDVYADPAFKAETVKQQLELDPVTGDQLQDILRRTYAAPKPVVDRLKALYEAGNQK